MLTEFARDMTMSEDGYERIMQHVKLAGRQLISVTELLEAILLHLPMREILLAQRVSRRFRGCDQWLGSAAESAVHEATGTTGVSGETA